MIRPHGCTPCDHTDDWERHDGVPVYRVPQLLFDILRPLPEAVRVQEYEVEDPELLDDPVALVRSFPPDFFNALARRDLRKRRAGEDPGGDDGDEDDLAAPVTAYSLDSVERARRKRRVLDAVTGHEQEGGPAAAAASLPAGPASDAGRAPSRVAGEVTVETRAFGGGRAPPRTLLPPPPPSAKAVTYVIWAARPW